MHQINYPQLSFQMVEQAFKIFIVYENLAACRQAEKIQDLLKPACAEEKVFSVFWNFALFRHEPLRRQAATEVAAADMIIISLAGQGGLPVHLRSWIDHWPNQVRRSALVALLNPDEKIRAEQKTHVSYLRDTAKKRGLDFFCNRTDWRAFARLDSVVPAGTTPALPAPSPEFSVKFRQNKMTGAIRLQGEF